MQKIAAFSEVLHFLQNLCYNSTKFQGVMMGNLRKVEMGDFYAGANLDVFVANEALQNEVTFYVYQGQSDDTLINFSTTLEELIEEFVSVNSIGGESLTPRYREELLSKIAHIQHILTEAKNKVDAMPDWVKPQTV